MAVSLTKKFAGRLLADAMASARPLLMLYSDQMRGSRVLADRYGALILAMAVRKEQPGRLAYISEFVEEAKAPGLVKRAVEHAGVRGVEVAEATR
jgi:polar amino acid transport system substrate-binding protein